MVTELLGWKCVRIALISLHCFRVLHGHSAGNKMNLANRSNSMTPKHSCIVSRNLRNIEKVNKIVFFKYFSRLSTSCTRRTTGSTSSRRRTARASFRTPTAPSTDPRWRRSPSTSRKRSCREVAAAAVQGRPRTERRAPPPGAEWRRRCRVERRRRSGRLPP